MKDENNNYMGFASFFLLIVFIVLVGSFLLYQNKKEALENKNPTLENNVISDKNKIQKDKEFIYFSEEEPISKTLNIGFKYPVINLTSEDAKERTEEIKIYVDTLKNSLVKITEEQTTCSFGEYDNIKEIQFLDYSVEEYQEFVTLNLYEMNYSCEKGVSQFQKMKSYTFDVLTGKLVPTTQLFLKYNKTLTNAIDKIHSRLLEEQTLINEIENIKIEETINSLKEQENYIVYINNYGELLMKYIVKTNTVDYNDTIIINE